MTLNIYNPNNCPVRNALTVLGSKWVLIILANLDKSKRYSELKRDISNITEKMLIEKLKLLEEKKFITRKDYKLIPPKVEYKITEFGKESLLLIPILQNIGLKMFENTK
jgi:DNA-binding HxlR family transcriptional regulator